MKLQNVANPNEAPNERSQSDVRKMVVGLSPQERPKGMGYLEALYRNRKNTEDKKPLPNGKGVKRRRV